MAADGESQATATATAAAAAGAGAPMKVAVDARGRPATFLEVIHEVEVSESAEFLTHIRNFWDQQKQRVPKWKRYIGI